MSCETFIATFHNNGHAYYIQYEVDDFPGDKRDQYRDDQGARYPARKSDMHPSNSNR